MMEHFRNPSSLVPGTSMPPIHLDDSQLSSLAAFLLKLTPQNARALEAAPDVAVAGAMVFKANQCGTCHTVNGEGMKIGPALNGLSQRRSKEWVGEQIRNPQSHSSETMMPPYKLSQSEMESLVTYLLSLPAVKSLSIAQANSEVLERFQLASLN
jgi:mono/diheme cytochrome c family protein